MTASDLEHRDLFISHASEDKSFVKFIADDLLRRGVSVWYDDYELRVGDSIRDKINAGLRQSRGGVVVLSRHFFEKSWPRQELNALVNLHLTGDEPRVLPVWLGVKHEDVLAADPLLANVKAIVSTGNYRAIAAELQSQVARWHGLVDPNHVRRAQVRLVDFPRDATDAIGDVTFEECLLQGPAVVFLRDGITFSQIGFNSPFMFWPVEPDRPYVGAIAVERVAFIRCRFKDVGFAVGRDSDILKELLSLPEGRQDYPEDLSGLLW